MRKAKNAIIATVSAALAALTLAASASALLIYQIKLAKVKKM